MVFYLNNDIIELVGEHYKKNKYWEISQPNRKNKEWWIKKYCFDQLFKKYISRFDGKVHVGEYRPLVNNGNHYSLYISPNMEENMVEKKGKELEKIEIICNRYRLLNTIVVFSSIKPSNIKNALNDKKHYSDVEEYIDCTRCVFVDLPYSEYKYNCFNGKNCIQCNRIQNYSDKLISVEDWWYMV
jgi:hypothetical protein